MATFPIISGNFNIDKLPLNILTCKSKLTTKKVNRRTKIPPRSEMSFNILKFFKNTLGKELTRLSFPLILNEPLSNLQRIIEFLEFSRILDIAALQTDIKLQTAMIGLYLTSNCMRASDRLKKPFNPLLCETFELDRWDEDEGYRVIVEQVIHHPPVAAIHVESKYGWTYDSNISFSSKFKLTQMKADLVTCGLNELYFKSTDTSFKVENPGASFGFLTSHPMITIRGDFNLKVINDKKDVDVTLSKLNIEKEFEVKSLLSSNNVTLVNKHNPTRLVEIINVFTLTFGEKTEGLLGKFNNSNRLKVKGSFADNKFKVKSNNYTEGAELVNEKGETLLFYNRQSAPGEALLKSNGHNLAQFSIQLNEYESKICPTDTRNRPDQRLFEIGDNENAQKVRHHLENNQRSRKKQCQNLTPKWFTCINNPKHQHKPIWQYNGDYFKQKEQGWTNSSKQEATKLYNFETVEKCSSKLSMRSTSSHAVLDSNLILSKIDEYNKMS